MILVIPSVILFKNKPQTPPSPSADSKRENFFNALKVLLNHKLFLILFVVQMMNYGTIMTFYHTQSFIYSPFGIGPTELTYFSIADSIGGLISLYCIGQWFKEYKKYKLSVILGYSGIIVSTLIQITMFKNYLNETNIWVLIGTQVLFGISEVPINGIFSELVCEVSYPIAEGTTYNIMNIGPQLWLLTMGGVFSSQIKEDKSMNFSIESFWIFNGILMMGLMIISFGIQENLRRENFDKSSLQMNIQ